MFNEYLLKFVAKSLKVDQKHKQRHSLIVK